MKNIIKSLFILTFAACCLQSCYEDKGNYDYQQVSELKIDTADSGPFITLYAAQIGAQLNYTPKVTYNKDASLLEFYWIIYPYPYVPVQQGNAMVYPQADTICRTHSLNWTVDAVPGSYTMTFVASDPANNLRSFYTFGQYFSIPKPGTKGGLYIMSEYGGKTDIDFYSTSRAMIFVDEKTPNYYSSLHSGEMIEGLPLFISFGKDYYYAFTDKKGLRLNVNGLQLMQSMAEMFYSPVEYKPQNLIYTNNCEFLVNNGKLHVMYTNKANDYKFSAPIGGDYEAGSFLALQTRTTYRPVANAIGADQIIYDKKSNSFRPYFPQNTALSQFKATTPTAYLNANNIGAQVREILESNGGKTLAIVRNNGRDSLFVFNFYNVVDNGDLSIGGNSRISLEGCTNIATAKYFAATKAGGSFFYATDKSVHSFSYTSGQTSQFDIYSCSASEEVTALYVMPAGGFPIGGKLLWVAVWDSSASSGKLLEYEIDANSGRPILQYSSGKLNPEIITGFGKIKSITVKM